MKISARIACFSLALVCSTPALATRATAQGVPSGAETFFLGTPRDAIWTGRVRGKDGQWQTVPPAQTMAADLKKELAEIQVSIEVKRDLDAARKQLDDLAIRATRAGYEGRKEVLVEVALARSKLLETIGKLKEARLAASSVLVNLPILADQAHYELVDSKGEAQATAAQIAADPRLQARVAKLEETSGDTRTADAGTKIEAIVKAALERGDTRLASDLGLAAIPALELEVGQSFESLPELNSDALWHLIRVSPARGAEFILASFTKGGPIWKARILRAMTSQDVLGSSGWVAADKAVSSVPPRLEVPLWRTVVEKLLADPGTARDAIPLLRPLVQLDALTPGLQAALVKLLMGPDGTLAAAAINLLQSGSARASVRPVLEAALTSTRAEVREFAGARLVEYPHSDALLAAFDHQDAAVRKEVAIALRCRSTVKPRYHTSAVRTDEEWTCPTVGSRERHILTNLVADADPQVRLEAAISITQLETPLAPKVYDAIANDPDARVRSVLLKAQAISAAERARLAESLAADPDPRVVEAYDNFIDEQNRLATPLPIVPFLPSIGARIQNPTRPFVTNLTHTVRRRLFERVGGTPEGLSALARWATLDSGASLVPEAIEQLRDALKQPSFQRRSGKARELGLDIDKSTWVKLFQLAHRSGDEVLARKAEYLLVGLDEDFLPQMLPMAQDRALDPRIRLRALDVAANTWDQAIIPTLREILADARWGNAIPGPELERVSELARSVPEDSAAQALDEVLADGAIDARATDSFTGGWIKSHTLSQDQARTILQRWLEDPVVRPAVEAALGVVATLPREQRSDWIERAAGSPYYVRTALKLIGDLHSPDHLDVLRKILSPDFWLGDTPQVQLDALNALTRYFDDSAADLILDVASSTASPKLREECFKALETIRKYQQEKGRWKEQRVSAEAWNTSVKQLVEMLDDKEAAVRAQAVRALATLNALSEMATIVRMLKDPDEQVRKAAEQALSTLNAPR